MGEMVEFVSNGGTCPGYLADGGGPGVVVIQEWWGLVPHIMDVCDRLAAAGFSALAPDLFRGDTTTEPDEAGKLMMSLNLDRAAKDMRGAVDFLLGSDAVTSSKVGVVGFCMGGGLALMVACDVPDRVGACAPYYGVIPWEGHEPDWTRLQAPVRGHFAELDGFFGPEMARGLEEKLRGLGKDVVLEIHPGCEHAFFNDSRPEVHDPAESARAWAQTLDFFGSALA